jgi:hypothetical protein
MKITSRESKNELSIPVTKKNEKDEAKSQKNNTNHNSS